MNEFADSIKKKLDTVLTEMHEYSWLFVKKPGKDFIRKRKLDFKEMINIFLSMGGNSLKYELMEYFSYDAETATSSAFVQQREKILPEALEYLFHSFTSSSVNPKYYKGFRILAIDGSDVNIAYDPKDAENHIVKVENTKGYNILHLNAMYDLCSRVYVDSIVQPGRKENEVQALIDMVDRSDIKEQTIVIADRGYESYNVFEHIAKKGWYYVIRVKDIKSTGITSGLSLPNQKEFDVEQSVLLTRKHRTSKKYRFMAAKQNFDYLPVGDKGIYPINFRVVRFAISENNYEVIITNLTEDKFPADKIKEIYHMRWGIETSFRELKYAIGLTSFHSKKATYIIQEIFARLTMYNFCEIITTHVVIQQKDRKYSYQVNFTIAILICMHYFRNDVSPPDVEALIQKNILPIRNGRKDTRKVRAKSAVSFIYRVA
ncbi:IS4 family transposase IS1675 [bioreactor metagenome]|uniref:IS4 family transposase IS1675 n=1 Tax=bioreactor metagenome TaxID=1076179 RepID=A0A645BVB1_9ZZZZ|nr:IS4 family transposase [Sedimentibacter saalensis]MEA5095490.1 IS4 family transposase [Sedimentibacter saalensis]